MIKNSRVAVCIAVAATMALAAPASAQAQTVIPGDTSGARTVVVDPSLARITVNPAGASASTVSAQFVNTSGFEMRCEDPMNTSRGSAVTEAEVAVQTMAFYESFGLNPNPVIPVAVSSLELPIDLTPLLGLLPFGSGAPAVGDNNAARSEITQAQNNAQQRGHTGYSTPYTLGNGQSITLNYPLGQPSAGPRTDFNAAVVAVCRATNGPRNGQLFAFAGYEDGEPETNPNGAIAIGSLGRR